MVKKINTKRNEMKWNRIEWNKKCILRGKCIFNEHQYDLYIYNRIYIDIYIYNIDYNTVYTNTHYKYQLNIYYKFNLYLNS